MKVSLNWVRRFTEIDASVDELVEKIGAQLGAVEDVEYLGDKYKGIVIVKVVSCQKHPNADKLSVCKIDDGDTVKDVERDKDGLAQVVCGAPNVRAGMLAVWLPPGSTVPSTFGKEPFELTARELRGQVSNGMLASAKELDISDSHEGILEIDNVSTARHKDKSVDINDHVAAFKNIELIENYKPGDDFSDAFGLDDYIIDIENKMFTHRPDCFGILGVAREIAGITGQKFTSPAWYVGEKTSARADADNPEFTISNNAGELVPRFMAQLIHGVKVGPSPVWMQTYLSRVGIRPINNIVDATNYMMYETAQPLHAYDYDKLKQIAKNREKNTISLETRMSKPGETLKLLNGKTIRFEDEATILVTSHDVPIGIGGVMGGADTEVDENTENIVLECANFDMYSIRRTAMAYGLFTDAVTRFNKGQSPWQCDRVLSKTVDEIICNGGGTPTGLPIDIKGELKRPITVHATVNFINSRLGTKLTEKAMAGLLENVEFGVRINGPTLAVTPPFWRTDIEIPEDVVEEIGRLHGYDKLPLRLPSRTIEPPPNNKFLQLKQVIRTTLAAVGANEVLTYSFVHGGLMEKAGQDASKAYKLANALSPDLQYYRLSLTPSLLDKVHSNIKAGYGEFALFEIGQAHVKGQTDPSEKNLPKEVNALSFVYAADDKAAKQHDGAAYYQARRYLQELLTNHGLSITELLQPLEGFNLRNNLWLEQTVKPFAPKRSAVIAGRQGSVWGVVGEYRQSVKKSLKMPEYCAGFEIDPTLILNQGKPVGYTQLSKYPSVGQDMTLQVSKDTAFAVIDKAVTAAITSLPGTKNTLVNRTVSSIYSPPKSDAKNITYHFKVASYQKTLLAEEVNKLLDDIAGIAGLKRI